MNNKASEQQSNDGNVDDSVVIDGNYNKVSIVKEIPANKAESKTSQYQWLIIIMIVIVAITVIAGILVTRVENFIVSFIPSQHTQESTQHLVANPTQVPLKLPANTPTFSSPTPVLTFTNEPETECNILDEDFTTNTRSWEEATVSTNIYTRSTQFLDGIYRHTNLFHANGTSPVYIPKIHPQNFTLSIDVAFQKLAGTAANNRIFIDLRSSGKGFYRVVLYASNGYSIRKNNTNLTGDIHSNTLDFSLGTFNNIRVDVRGTTLTLYANKEQLNQISDIVINQEGEIAFGAAKADSYGETTVDFDNLCIQS